MRAKERKGAQTQVRTRAQKSAKKSAKSETGIGGVKTYRTLEGGGELTPKVVPGKLGLLTPEMNFL